MATLLIKTTLFALSLSALGCAAAPPHARDLPIGESTTPGPRCGEAVEERGEGWFQKRWASCASDPTSPYRGTDEIGLRRYEGDAPTPTAFARAMVRDPSAKIVLTSERYEMARETVALLQLASESRSWLFASVEHDLFFCVERPEARKFTTDQAAPRGACVEAITSLVRSRYYE